MRVRSRARSPGKRRLAARDTARVATACGVRQGAPRRRAFGDEPNRAWGESLVNPAVRKLERQQIGTRPAVTTLGLLPALLDLDPR